MNWTPIIVALIAAGLLKYVIDGIRWFYHRYRGRSPERKQAAVISTVDQSLAVVAKARDELEADNARLRVQLAESDARHEVERARWGEEKAAMRNEINDLERRLRELLAEVQNLKTRHA